MENLFHFMAAMEAMEAMEAFEMLMNHAFLREATERFDKQALLQIHDDFARHLARYAAEGSFQIQSDPIISSAGTACSVPLERLNSISFNELKVGEVHRGRVVYGTLCAKLNLTCGIMTVLEDDNGLAVRLAIYNVALSEAGIKKLYPKGAKVAIKEPCFKIANDGGLLIRVDNPANVVKPVFEKEKRTESPSRVDVEDIREKGNKYFKEQNWDAAAEHYTKCIDASLLQLKEGGSSKNKKMINNSLLCAYSNRAETWLQMKEFKRALEDSNAALRIDPKHLKALYRKGRALLGLKLYKAACECLKKADKTSPGHKEIQEVLGQAMTLYAQSLNGKYDISDYLLGVATSSPPEVADFVGPVEIKMTEDGRGRGLYATREIRTGQLFLVSNPVAVAHDTAFPTLLYSEKTLNMASQEDLVAAVACAANKSQRLLRQLYSLHHSSTSGSLDVPPIDLFKSMDDLQDEQNENLEVDVNRIRDITNLNGFSGAVETFFSKSEIYKARLAPQRGQSGLWLLPSFINHSCLPNSKSLHVGSAMFIHASKPIKRGEEMTISYFDTLLPLPQRQARCKRWGFKCNCRRCILEHSLSASLGPITNARFDRLHDKAMDELNASRIQKQPFDADLPACAEFLRLFVKAEEIIRNSQVLKTEEEKHWIRASFVSAYLAGTQSKTFHSTMMNGCFPSGQKIMKAIQSTDPGDFRNLNMAAWQFKDFLRWMGDENESLITRQASEQATGASISVFGSHSEDVLKALVLKFKTQ